MKTLLVKKITRLKFLGHVEMGQSPPSTNYSLSVNDGLPFLQGTADFGSEFPEPKVFCNSPTKVANTGDILFSVRAPVGDLNMANRDFGIGRGLCSVRVGHRLHVRFAWWALHEAREQLNYVSTGSTYEAVSAEDVSNLRLFDITTEEQIAIADYLDRETAKIDALISAKEGVLDLLTEKRQALITRAVTRGLNSDAPLKDSGVSWLGKIPAHWDVMKLKHVTSLKSGDAITSESIAESGDYPVFGGNGIRGYTSSFTHSGNYVLIGRQGALCGNINYASGRFWASEHAIVASIKDEHNFVWLGELLHVMNLNQHSQSAAQPGLAVDLIANLAIPVPPLPEQSAIVAYIQKETAKLDALRAAAERTIGLLKERRSALIAAVVTGKMQLPSTIAENSDN